MSTALSGFSRFFQRIGWGARYTIEYLGGAATLAMRTVRRSFSGRFPLRATIYQVEQLGISSLGIAIVTALSVGMVMALQFAYGLSRFGAGPYVGVVVSLSIIRELGPVLTALMVGGRIASGMAAELGSMKVTDQIDAIMALGADPIRKLVIPRVVATVLFLPLLTVLADIIGIFGGMIISSLEMDMSPTYFLDSVLSAVKLNDFFSGLGKSVFFAFFISVIGCYQGFCTGGGTEGVGRSTTKAVVASSAIVLISDFFLTKLFLLIG